MAEELCARFRDYGYGIRRVCNEPESNELHGPWGAPSCGVDCLELHHPFEPARAPALPEEGR